MVSLRKSNPSTQFCARLASRMLSVWALFILLALSSCNRALDRADLVFINGAEPELLDPALITAQATSRVAYALLEGLTIFGPDASAQPGVATHWDISPDGCLYTFHLRSDAVWSNGEPLTSADFVYAWKRALLPSTGSEYASQFYPIVNAEAFNTEKLTDFAQVGITALDAHTLQVRLSSSTPYFPDLCAFATYLPVHAASCTGLP